MINNKLINKIKYNYKNKIINIPINDSIINKYILLKTFRETKYKSVYLVKSKLNNNKYIIKFFKTNSNPNINKIFNLIKKNKHINVINAHYNIHLKYTSYYIYKYFDGVDLHKFTFKNKKKLKDSDYVNILLQITKGIIHLHNLNIIHCDLKLDNIIINSNKDIKIIDIDTAKICNPTNEYMSKKIFGTLPYIAPESYDLNIYSRKSDIWSLGILFFILLTKKYPYTNLSPINTLNNLYRRNTFKHINNLHYIIDNYKHNKTIIYLIKHMLEFNPNNRINNIDIIRIINKKN